LVLVKGDRQTGSQVSPTTHRILVLVKGNRRRDLRLAQPRKFWFWFKEITQWDLRKKERKRKREKERKKKRKGEGKEKEIKKKKGSKVTR